MGKSRSGKRGAGHKREEGPFFAKPIAFLKSPLYRRLSRSAKVLIDDLGAQYNMENNGQLLATFNRLKDLGWGSEETLFHARRELEEAGITVETKKGGYPNRASWYALTFFDLDPHTDYDIKGSAFMKGMWRVRSGLIATEMEQRSSGKSKLRAKDSCGNRSSESGETSKIEAIRPKRPSTAATDSGVDSRLTISTPESLDPTPPAPPPDSGQSREARRGSKPPRPGETLCYAFLSEQGHGERSARSRSLSLRKKFGDEVLVRAIEDWREMGASVAGTEDVTDWISDRCRALQLIASAGAGGPETRDGAAAGRSR